ncbi:MAG TPA: GNAT family N-acetyltransferase [Azospirillaceae bacterium]|nr:GNAT family N-acetyltransferase [Azospirillaceae bacterium]
MAQPTLRQAHAGDLDALLEIEAASFPSDQLSRRAMRRLIADGGKMIVAQQDGRVVGYCCVLRRRTSRSARLYSIAVRADTGGRGVGRALLAAAEALSVGAGCTSLRLEVRTHETRAVRFYEAAGYRRIADLPGYYADGAPALRMCKALIPPTEPFDQTAVPAAPSRKAAHA